MKQLNTYQHGQAALIALLVLTIATTVGLSLIARSTTDISITRTLEESSRAFSAAEAGIELGLQSGVSTSAPLNSATQTSYSVTVATVSASPTSPLTFPRKTPNQTTETVWLVPHNGDGTINDMTPYYTASSITVCWGPLTSGMAVTMLYKKASDGSYRVAKALYNPAGSGPGTTQSLGCSGTSITQTISFAAFGINPAQDVLIYMRLRPTYTPAQITIVPAQGLPPQGNQITSVGQTASGVSRKIVVFQAYPSAGSVFDAAVYSEGSFSQ